MSAWYILAASGIHPITPGDTRYELTSPAFSKIIINADKDTKFSIKAVNNSEQNIYIQSASLNGKPYNKCWIDYKELIKGGELTLQMGAAPNKNWGLDKY
jgi:putative alpha-1,2-mannosidase